MSVFKKCSLAVFAFLLAACLPQGPVDSGYQTPTQTQTPGFTPTPMPTRPEYNPGQLVEYTAQAGDTLPALAARFNTTVSEIRAANPELGIPDDATTMPAGMPMEIPIYYLPFWGTIYQILPDSQFVNGPAAASFDTKAFVAKRPGWLKDFRMWAGDANRTGAEIVDLVGLNYSLNPQVLLALLEYQTGALSQPVPPSGDYPLGEIDYKYAGLYMQLIWAANMLNNGYYGWRTGVLTEIDHPDGTIERPDPWQTAATVGFQYYFSAHSSTVDYTRAVNGDGIAKTFRTLFGDPWEADQAEPPLIPVSLEQPDFSFPFAPGETWVLTGGPHTGWGSLMPWAALDFAPPAVVGGCVPTNKMAVAVADGTVVRSEPGVVMLDLDGDGNERTGWDILYLHLASEGRAPVGKKLKQGQPVGYPSCEGGTATGTHVHLARKYNGEWIPADSAIPFNLEGWIAHNGYGPYSGTLQRGNRIVTACDCSDFNSHIRADK
jgi:murein DD-endopeptidase MepM/ murein hydrolase activator NlpD